MERELKLYRITETGAIVPFPNEVDDAQISITTFTYNAQRMAATPTITATVNYPRCLDNDWDVNVYAEYNGEKYYIRQIPSSSKDNTSVMYRHDITLYSERFILENIYLRDVGKGDDTNVIILADLKDFIEIINKSLAKSDVAYRIRPLEERELDKIVGARDAKEIALDKVYISTALQEIYNQWNVPYYFDKNEIVVGESKDEIPTPFEYGAENSLLKVQKQNANFRKITKISGTGSDKNIPFYYPNWSQKGIIEARVLPTNTKLLQEHIVVDDMKKFEKFMPLGEDNKVVYKAASEFAPSFTTQPARYQTKINEALQNKGVMYPSIELEFETFVEGQTVELGFQIFIDEYLKIGVDNASGTRYGNSWNLTPENIAKELMCVYEVSDKSYFIEKSKIPIVNVGERPTLDFSPETGLVTTGIGSFNDSKIHLGKELNETINITKVEYKSSKDSTVNGYHFAIKRTISGVVTGYVSTAGKYVAHIALNLTTSNSVQNQIAIGSYKYNKKQYNQNAVYQMYDYCYLTIDPAGIRYTTENIGEGWYLNGTEPISLSKIGVSLKTIPSGGLVGEGFYQAFIDMIPHADNLMPTLYRDSMGERKFYKATNYPLTSTTEVDELIGEYQGTHGIQNDKYKKDNNDYYIFETEWNSINQNEHIQEFPEIYPSIEGITNSEGQLFGEILEVAFDDNDNNEVNEEGEYIHPYFYVRIPIFDGDNGFNLFDQKIVGSNMQVVMTSGDCAACAFEIHVLSKENSTNPDYEDVANPILVTMNYPNGEEIVSGNWEDKTTTDWSKIIPSQQNSKTNSIWLVLQKDKETFNETYPNTVKSVVPKPRRIENGKIIEGDKFVLLNIDMPKQYVLAAEEKLRKEAIEYMAQNNSDKWNFSIDFSRIFLAENESIFNKLTENSKLYVKYNNTTYPFYVNNYTYKVKSNEALPKISVSLSEKLTINRGITQTIADGIKRELGLSDEEIIYATIVDEDFDKTYLRKISSENMPNNMTFDKGIVVKGGVETSLLQSQLYSGDETIGSGFKLEEDENGESTLIVDNVNVRKKIQATEFVIQQIQFQGGIVVQSAAAMECSRVEEITSGEKITQYKCYFDTKNGTINNQFVIGDLARCQRIGYAPKYYWRVVVGVGNDYILLSNIEGEYDDNSDAPSAGDIIVQMGNADAAFADRQSAIVMNTVGENSPSFIMYSGIEWFSLEGKDITGIVYHQQETLDNGKIVAGYPELYSYGAMYFGDRAKENNFIQFQQNESGTYEMVIKAKSVFNSVFQDGSTIVDGGVVVTSVLSTQNSGIVGLEDNDIPRFWAGSSFEDANTAPFRVYEDGRVFGTNFYGFQSAFRVTESDIVDYMLDVRQFGSKVLLDFPTGLANALTFPSGMEYVGAEIELFNPYNRPVAICGQNIISPMIATLDNAFESIWASAHISGYAYIYKENQARIVGSDDLYVIPRWSLKNINSCSVPNTMPNYMKWKCICFSYSSNEYNTQNVNANTYYIRVGQSAYIYFLPLWVLAESSSDVTFSLEIQ